MTQQPVRYFVFDIESVADAALVAKLKYPSESLEPTDAVDRYRGELMEKYGKDFIPYTFQIPISVVVGKVGANFRLIDLVVLDEPEFRTHVIVENFWRGWEKYRRPTLVSFNGRTFDVPLLELAAFRYGLSLPAWFDVSGRSFEQPRSRFNVHSHIDLCELLTNFGSTRFTGGLNLAANLLGKPGKIDVHGQMVQDMYNEGRLAEINNYCCCDVLDTYFVFLRTRVLFGQLTLDDEQTLIQETKQWIKERTESCQAYGHYLENWGDWKNPWATASDDSTASDGSSDSHDSNGGK